MNAVQMRNEFLQLYDKVTNLAAPGYLDDEIEGFLNRAQLLFVKWRYNNKGNKYGEGVEATEKRRKDLNELVRNVELSGAAGSGNTSDQTGVLPQGEFFDLPGDFLYTLMEEVTIKAQDPCYDGDRLKVKPTTHDEYNAYIDNPFKRPDPTIAWRLDFSKDAGGTSTQRHEIVTGDGIKVASYHIRYIKVPIEIDVLGNNTCELNPSVHSEIVKIAVAEATGVTVEKEYQIRSQEARAAE